MSQLILSPDDVRYPMVSWREAGELVTAELHRMGFPSATTYVSNHPSHSLSDLMFGLVPDSLPDQSPWYGLSEHHLLWLLWCEAVAIKASQRCARDLLYRRWCQPERGRWIEPSKIFDAWRFDLPSQYRDSATRVYTALRASSLSPLWSPRAPDDPDLVELVGSVWLDRDRAGSLQLALGAGPLISVIVE